MGVQSGRVEGRGVAAASATTRRKAAGAQREADTVGGHHGGVVVCGEARPYPGEDFVEGRRAVNECVGVAGACAEVGRTGVTKHWDGIDYYANEGGL